MSSRATSNGLLCAVAEPPLRIARAGTTQRGTVTQKAPAPQSTITVSLQKGRYIGVDSQFSDRARSWARRPAMLDPHYPSQAQRAKSLDVRFAENVPRVVTSRRAGASSSMPSTELVFAGGVFGYIDQ
jgi:hypothetical protein